MTEKKAEAAKAAIDYKDMNIYQKLQHGRVLLQQRGIEKTGLNDFSHYTYFELGDFLPHIMEIELALGLTSLVSFNSENALLKIINTDNIAEEITFNSPTETATLKGMHGIQNMGAVETYQRRYLYMVAYEVSDSDALDSGTLSAEKEPEGDVQISKTLAESIVSDLETLGVKVEKFCNLFGVASIDCLSMSQMPKVQKAIETTRDEWNKKHPQEGPAETTNPLNGLAPEGELNSENQLDLGL